MKFIVGIISVFAVSILSTSGSSGLGSAMYSSRYVSRYSSTGGGSSSLPYFSPYSSPYYRGSYFPGPPFGTGVGTSAPSLPLGY
ncbi:ECU06_0575 [Encephalitozoon cuniculi GB-M1]|uniref:ECU06_0575 protein n=1 Tax=Encephalitozoon cuniculi (strain GB-M1) TaxID=284813 RepID=I7L8I8_ENCCU|nr:uncharacterized protein ECU06_0575 [Encephalitozoon cuniculi GB-M1]CCI73942.1 ECU06_0575 [Encephalitozoon cuniculi GB-M1]